MFLAISVAAAAAAAPTSPNFVMLLADDWGWGDVGNYAKLVNAGALPSINSLKLTHIPRFGLNRFHNT